MPRKKKPKPEVADRGELSHELATTAGERNRAKEIVELWDRVRSQSEGVMTRLKIPRRSDVDSSWNDHERELVIGAAERILEALKQCKEDAEYLRNTEKVRLRYLDGRVEKLKKDLNV